MGLNPQTSLGYASAGIGKLLVFDSRNSNIAPTVFELKDVEYWMYKSPNCIRNNRG